MNLLEFTLLLYMNYIVTGLQFDFFGFLFGFLLGFGFFVKQEHTLRNGLTSFSTNESGIVMMIL